MSAFLGILEICLPPVLLAVLACGGSFIAGLAATMC